MLYLLCKKFHVFSVAGTW